MQLMKEKLLKPTFLNYFFVGLVVMMLAFLGQGRLHMSDFKVYYGATSNFWGWPIDYKDFGLGSKPTGKVYFQPYGLSSGNFKYAPFALFAITPLATLPWQVARIIFYLLTTVAIVVALTYSFKQMGWFRTKGRFFTRDSLAVGLLALITGQHLYRELWLGNINALLLCLVLLSFSLTLNRKQITAGIALGLAIALKPHFALFFVFYFAARKFKAAMVCGLTIMVLLLLPMLFLGWNQGLGLTADWYQSMTAHNSTKLLVNSNHTLYRYVYDLLALEENSLKGALAILGLLGLAFVVLQVVLFRRAATLTVDARETFWQKAFLMQGYLILATIPMLVLTDSEHFLWSMPLIAFLLLHLFENNNRLNLLGLVIAFVAYGGNWHDLVGHKASVAWDAAGILGLGNLVLILTGLYLFLFREPAEQEA